ncbi:hypothetical protein LTR15_009065 [Elasticomyces elasticus]|nr:hypothetical protein LTR15_009065 [Elasticomyces elasticus]
MAEMYELLLAEIDRVVNSPYPTQLKSLRDVVCTKCSGLEIERSLQARSCQVERLAVLLLAGLRHWPYVLEIITKLCMEEPYYTPMRDALLKQEPTLLPVLLEQATPHDGVHPKYTAAAVAMLAHPLPDHYALPATAQMLFLRLVEAAAEVPSAEALKPVFSLLQGTSTLLVGLLSNDTLSRLEDQLDAILRSNYNRTGHDSGDPLRTLHCLAIMHLIALPADDERIWSNSVYQTQDLLASTQANTVTWSPVEMQKYFNDTKAPKTLQLVVLQVMWACQASSESFDDRLATLKLANVLMNAVPTELKDAWCSSNNAVVQRLQQKALACHQSKELQLHAYALICQLCKPVSLQCSVVESIRHALADPHTFAVVSYSGLEAHWSHCMWEIMDGSTVEKFLENLLDILGRANPVEMVESAHSLASAMQQLARLSLEKSDIAEAARAVLSTSSTTRQLQTLLPSPDQTDATRSCEQGIVCPSIWLTARNRILHELCSLLLKSAFITQHPDDPVPSSSVSLLLEIHAVSANTTPLCSHRRRHEHPQHMLTLRDRESTPSTHGLGDDWRGAMEAHLVSEARSSHDVLRGLFAQACQELESRCETVEQPLAEERNQRLCLQNQHDQLQEAYNELEAQVIDRRLHYQAVETEQESCLKRLDAAQEETDVVRDKLHSLEQMHETELHEAHARLAELKQAKETADLQHATVLSKLEEDIEDLRERHREAHADLQKYEAQAERLANELRVSEAACEALQVQVDRLSEALQEKAANMQRLESTRSEAAAETARLEAALQSVQEELGQEKQNHERNVQHVKEQSRQNAEAANASHNDAIDRMAATHGEEVADLQRQIAEGEDQVKRLQRKCRQKDDQIAEANAMRSNLLAALGGGAQSLAQPSLPHRTRSSLRTQIEPTQADVTPTTPSFALDIDSQAFDGGASFASNDSSSHSRNGPTPKRAKPRKSIKIASPAKPRMSMSTRAVKSAVKRRPLGVINANTSPRKDGVKTPSRGQVEAGADEFDDSTFDEHDLHNVREMGGMEEDTEV